MWKELLSQGSVNQFALARISQGFSRDPRRKPQRLGSLRRVERKQNPRGIVNVDAFRCAFRLDVPKHQAFGQRFELLLPARVNLNALQLCRLRRSRNTTAALPDVQAEVVMVAAGGRK